MTITITKGKKTVVIEISVLEITELANAIQVDQVVTEKTAVDTSNCYRPTDVYKLVDTVDGISYYKNVLDYVAWYGPSSGDRLTHEDPKILVKSIKARL